MQEGIYRHPASYRDPSGFVFTQNNILYRQVNKVYQQDFEQLLSSGLYEQLCNSGLLIPHQIVQQNFTGSDDWLITLKPHFISCISYPYEWCFEMLKEAALLTLQLAKAAMAKGMMLKDASPYNVQWHKGKMIFIDTLSFEKYDSTQPWIAYRQFCENFLAPLALMHYLKMPLQSLILSFPNGINLGMAQKLLPFKSRLNLNTWLHLHLQAKMAATSHNKRSKAVAFSEKKLHHILNSLEEMISSFSMNEPTGIWSGYYEEAHQRKNYVTHKKQIIDEWLQSLPQIKTALDAGANEGEFSELLAAKRIVTLAADADHFSINSIYKKVRSQQNRFILPLLIDLTHPSPSIGVNNEERSSWMKRVQVDLVLALAVIHHLAIGSNISLEQIAKMFSQLGQYLIIEFVPKEDEKTQQLLAQKKIDFPYYHLVNFEQVFSCYFTLVKKSLIADTSRVLYLMKKK